MRGGLERVGVRISEHRIRRFLVIAMTIWLFLPFNRPPDVQPNILGLIIVLFEATLILAGRPPSGDIVLHLFQTLLMWFGIPLLLILNLRQASSSSRLARILYVLLLLYLLPTYWCGVFHIDERFRSVGYWTGVTLVSSAVLLEIMFFMLDRRGKAQLAN